MQKLFTIYTVFLKVLKGHAVWFLNQSLMTSFPIYLSIYEFTVQRLILYFYYDGNDFAFIDIQILEKKVKLSQI